MNHDLLKKSLAHRNFEAFKKLDQREADLRWSKTNPPPLPFYKKTDIIKENAGYFNFIKDVLKDLRP